LGVGQDILRLQTMSGWVTTTLCTGIWATGWHTHGPRCFLGMKRSRHLRSAYLNRSAAFPYTLSPPCVEGQAHRSL